MLFCFLSNQENLRMIHHNSNLFYDIYNTINEHNQRQTHYRSSILPIQFDIFFWSDLESSSITSSASSLIMISILSLFDCITWSSSLPSEEIKLIAIVNWIFHVSDILKSFMISFKYRLILLGYSSTDSVFCNHGFCIQYNYYSKNYQLLLSYDIFFKLKKVCNISNYSVSCFCFFSYFSLKRFLISLIMLFSIFFLILRKIHHFL